MAQKGVDTLLALTDSRYRLSMIVARRAAQLKANIPTVLPSDQYPQTRNMVTVASEELRRNAGIVWGDDLPTTEDLRKLVERERQEENANYSVRSRRAASSEAPAAADSDDSDDSDDDA